MDKLKRELGFTLVEMAVAITLMLPLMFFAVSSTRTVTGSISTSEHSADVTEAIRTAEQRLTKMARPAMLSTCKFRATSADVAWYIANALPPPTVGDWISPRDGERRPTFQFQSALGGYSFLASAVSNPHSLEFVLDSNEVDNGIDDDNDGLVDEGRLVHEVDGRPRTLLNGVENCEFWLNGSVLAVSLTCARRDSQGIIYRQTHEYRTTMRNN